MTNTKPTHTSGVLKMERVESPPVPSDIQKRIDKIHAAKRIRDAAPDLLAACKIIQGRYDSGESIISSLLPYLASGAIRAVIAKAEGR